MELDGYSRPTYNKLVHSATMRSTIIGAIHKLTVDEFVDNICTPPTLHRRLAVAKFSLSPQCKNYSRDPNHAHLEESQSS